MTGYLTRTDGDDYAHVYIATLCTYQGDVIRCGVRDNPDDQGSNIVEFIDHAVGVTLKLRTTGEIVQTHTQPEHLAASREEILALVDAERQTADLDIVQVDLSDMRPGELFRIDPNHGSMQRADEKRAKGFGGSGSSPAGFAGVPEGTRVTFGREPPRP